LIIRTHQPTIGVLGAGIIGCCLALELAQRGYLVDLIDKAIEPMTGASLHNEGKLHLGFVYAKDPLKETHKLMARGSLSFSRIIEKLTGCSAASMIPSQPFHYFIPIDSQLDLDAIQQHFTEVEKTLLERSCTSGDLYLGRKIEKYFERNSAEGHRHIFSPELTLGSFKTNEVSVSPVAVAQILRRTINDHPNIRFRGNTHIHSVFKLPSGDIKVENQVSDDVYPCVANCLWEDKLRVDGTAGVQDKDPWILRYKATITLPANSADLGIPSATGILGKYGDVVNHNNGSYYLSWYPLCKLAEGVNEKGENLQDAIHPSLVVGLVRKLVSGYPEISRLIGSFAHKGFIRDNILEMANYVPSVAQLWKNAKHGKLGGGVILARGETDIDDPQSRLHQRSRIGPVAHETYITVETGKYCTAPMFAIETADIIEKIV